MSGKNILFIALEEYNNLGVGYLSAVLRRSGYKTSVIDLCQGNNRILRKLKQMNPVIAGFSIISYGYIYVFADLVRFLRNKGITCHFTAGGHYSSLLPEQIFKMVPGLDSIVRFEGENTIVDLADCLSQGRDLANVDGLMFRKNEVIISNPLRPLEKDLDNFPFPVRTRLRKFFFNASMATILAGRGCINMCTFCNTRAFYREAGGPLKRIRKPELVVREMKYLYTKRKCNIFMFMDDDFPVTVKHGAWVREFCSLLDEGGLSDKIIWKICCRPDEVDEELFTLMKSHGLFLVFLGIEEGTNNGLEKINKQITVEEITGSIQILKKLHLGIDYGFMLFQPSTTFNSLEENLKFLEMICDDGYMPVTFLKMIPLYKTPVDEELKNEGRLIPGIPCDYRFLNKSLDEFYRFTMENFGNWLLNPEGMSNMARWIRNYYLVYSRFIGTDLEWRKYNASVKKTIKESNRYILSTLLNVSLMMKRGKNGNSALGEVTKGIKQKHEQYLRRLGSSYDQLYFLTLFNTVKDLKY